MRTAIAASGLVLVLSGLAPVAAVGGPPVTNATYRFTASGTSVVDRANGSTWIALTGSSNQLGPFEQTEQGLVLPVGPDHLSFTSSWRLTAANGDQLLGTCDRGRVTYLSAVEFRVVTACQATGGTGRFDGARAKYRVVVRGVQVLVAGSAVYSNVTATGRGRIRLLRPA